MNNAQELNVLQILNSKITVNQIENSVNIIEQEFQFLQQNISTVMKKLTNNNVILSDLYKESLEDLAVEIDKSIKNFKILISQCEQLQDNFLEVDILAKKMQLKKQYGKISLENQFSFGFPKLISISINYINTIII